MKQVRKIIILALSTLLLTNMLFTQTSCLKNREMYDSSLVDSMLKWRSPISRIDSFHTFKLTTTQLVTVTANANVTPVKVQILTDNPRESGTARLLTQTTISKDKSLTLGVTYPTLLTTLYAALVDSAGAYTVAAFDPSTGKVNFARPLFSGEKIAYTPEPMTYAYLYESEFPMPGDHDFNDVVLHISLERIAERQLRMNVQLAAVGAKVQMAACVRLKDYDFDDIESVATVDSVDFNYKFPDQVGMVLGHKDELLIKGLHGEAVINLFEDAHWATGDFLDESYGVFPRKQYNVNKGTNGSQALMIVPRTVSYIITFKDGLFLDEYTIDQLDPFIITAYGGGGWEIHLKGDAYAQTLFTYNSNELKYLPWALMVPSNTIPSGSFRHPLEGYSLGFYVFTKEGGEAHFGAYNRSPHAFGEWAENQTKATDWYLYPSVNIVF